VSVAATTSQRLGPGKDVDETIRERDDIGALIETMVDAQRQRGDRRWRGGVSSSGRARDTPDRENKFFPPGGTAKLAIAAGGIANRLEAGEQ